MWHQFTVIIGTIIYLITTNAKNTWHYQYHTTNLKIVYMLTIISQKTHTLEACRINGVPPPPTSAPPPRPYQQKHYSCTTTKPWSAHEPPPKLHHCSNKQHKIKPKLHPAVDPSSLNDLTTIVYIFNGWLDKLWWREKFTGENRKQEERGRGEEERSRVDLILGLIVPAWAD